jgi:hypothetical protein
MKKLLVFLVMFGVLMLGVGSVMATAHPVTTSYIGTKGTGQASISSLYDVSSPNSAKLSAPFDNSLGPEGRVRIEFPGHDFTLNDLSTLSWAQYVTEGYMAHVDVLLDLDNDGVYDTGDDALVFEGAKVNTAHCDATPYPTGALTTFGSTLGEEINSGSYAWLSSGPAGGCSTGPETFFWHTLAAWKAGPETTQANGKTISGSTKVLALEFEVDGWIAASEAYLDDITLNGVVIENFDVQTTQVQDTQVNIGDVIQVIITPSKLDFGKLAPGSTGTGPNIGISVSGSNTDVRVAISEVTGFPFMTGLSVNGGVPTSQIAMFDCLIVGDTCTFSPVSWATSLSVPSGAPAGVQTGTIIYTITGPAP